MRLTKIICTLGPACRSEEGLRKLLEGGMDVSRLNFSHGSHDEHGETIKRLRAACKEMDQTVAIMMDTKGPAIRTLDRKEPLIIKEKEEVVFSPLEKPKTKGTVIQVDHAGFVKDAKGTKTILVDNGEIVFEVLEVTADGVRARAQSDGKMGSRRHVNLPGAKISLPSITEKDWSDIEFGCQQGLDFVALSFVRCKKDIEDVRDFIAKKKGNLKVIAKIENGEALENIVEIIEAADGLMVARGDLGSEIPFEKVPAVQDELVARCRNAGKPVIVATHMLESMIHSPLPTRAEVTDIAHAAVTGSDCTMLSGETASGAFPYRALNTMHRVLVETEKARLNAAIYIDDDEEGMPPQAHAVAAVTMASELKATAIVVFTKSGGIAKAVSRLRPTVPVLAFMDEPTIERNAQMYFAVEPLHLAIDATEKTVEKGIAILKKKMLVSSGDHVVIISPAAEHDRSVRTVRSYMVP
jgi:pyruvate kinase